MNNMQKSCVIIVAAGKGKRMGTKCAKQFLDLNGKPVLAHTLDKFEINQNIDNIIIVVGEEQKEYCERNILKKYMYKKVSAVVEGGKERQDSVYNGLKSIPKDTSIVLVHDAVRPFIEQKQIDNVIITATEKKACALAVPVKDTIKYVNEDNVIEQTPDRNRLWAVQTPQGFTYDILIKAYEHAIKYNYIGTDDAALVEVIHDVHIVEGSYKNIKITTKEDLDYGKVLLTNL